jgi:hypothetical protein
MQGDIIGRRGGEGGEKREGGGGGKKKTVPLTGTGTGALRPRTYTP